MLYNLNYYTGKSRDHRLSRLLTTLLNQNLVFLLEIIKHTEEYALRNYPEYQEGVEDMMSETLKLKSLEAIKEAKLEAEIKGRLEGRLEGKKKATKEMLKTMHEDGVDIEYIKKLGRKQGLTEKEIENIVGLKK